MTYYKPKYEQFDRFTGWTTTPGELLTEKERFRRFRYLPDSVFRKVKISEKQTYKFQGVRFAYQFTELLCVEGEPIGL